MKKIKKISSILIAFFYSICLVFFLSSSNILGQGCENLPEITGPISSCGYTFPTPVFHYHIDKGSDPAFTWSGINVTITNPTASSADVKWTSAGGLLIYTVSATCSDTLYLQPCCVNPNHTDITIQDFDNHYQTLTDLYNNVIQPACPTCVLQSANWLQITSPTTLTVQINGILNIESPNVIEWNNVDLSMSPGSTIYIPSGTTGPVTLYNNFMHCSLHDTYDCRYMWNGFKIRDHGRLGLSSTSIKDAEFAIQIYNREAMVRTFDCQFSRNFVSIYAPEVFGPGAKNGFSFYSNPSATSLIENTVFSGLDPIHDLPYLGQTGIPEGHKSYAGALLYNWDNWAVAAPYYFPSGLDPAYTNSFEDLNIGILVHNGFFDLYNTQFININPDASAYLGSIIWNGTGVYSDNLCLGCNTFTANIGEQNNVGIENFENRFENCWRGIGINGNIDSKLSFNQFSNTTWNGIGVINADNRTIQINDNSLSSYDVGILAYELRNSVLSITNNHFNSNQNYYQNSYTWISTGMSIGNMASTTINSMEIYNNDFTDPRIGMYLFNIDGNVQNIPNIHDNTLNYDQPFSFFDPVLNPQSCQHNGIWLDNTSELIVEHNLVDRTVGINGAPQGFEKNLRGFNIKFSHDLFVTENRAKHLGTGMRWLSTCYGGEMHCNYFLNDFQGVFLDYAGMSEQGHTNDAWDNQWVVFAPHTRVAGTSLNFTPFKWYNQGDLNNPANNFSTLPFDLFTIIPFDWQLSNEQCYSPGPRDEDMFEKIVDDDISHQYFPDEARYYDKDYAYKKFDDDASFRNSNPDYLAFYNSTKMEGIGKFKDVKNYLNTGDYASALTLVNQVTDDNAIIHNLKLTLGIAIEKKLNPSRTLSTAEISELTSIAYTTAWEGGEGVFYARAILGIEVDDQTNGLRKAHTSSNNDLPVSLYPNPVRIGSSLTVVANVNDVLRAKITDISGRLIGEYGIYGNQLPIVNILPGIYLIEVFDSNNNKIISKPIAIIQ